MHTCVRVHTHSHTDIKKFNLPIQILLSDDYKNYKNVNCLTKVRHHTGMHPACMHVNTCTYIPQHTSTSIQLNGNTQKYINFWLWPKRPPLAFYMAEMSVAEMSWPKCPWPKREWPKYPTCSDISATDVSATDISATDISANGRNVRGRNILHSF